MATQLTHRNIGSFWFSPVASLRASDCRDLGILPSLKPVQPQFNLGKCINNSVTPF